MTEPVQNVDEKTKRTAEGARAILRVPEVLIAVASGGGVSFAELHDRLGVPKSSLHRLLRTLEQGGYLSQRSGAYTLGPASRRLSQKLASALPAGEFPGSARPILEWIARETNESAMLAVLTGDHDEVSYVDVINSPMPLRVTVPLGQKRPLYAAASGQAILAFLPHEEQESYLARTNFQRFTADTVDRKTLAGKLDTIRERGVAFDCNGSFIGAGAVASPCFDKMGGVRCAISVAGPTERLEQMLDRLYHLSLEAGERISRILGFAGAYPPFP